jgi:hypothetical protein
VTSRDPERRYKNPEEFYGHFSDRITAPPATLPSTSFRKVFLLFLDFNDVIAEKDECTHTPQLFLLRSGVSTTGIVSRERSYKSNTGVKYSHKIIIKIILCASLCRFLSPPVSMSTAA